MSSQKATFTVLGAGNGGVATAADLTIRGFDVHLWEHPDYAESIRPMQEIGGVHIEKLPDTPTIEGFANIKLITTDIAQALDGTDVVMVVVPSFAQRTFAEYCAPHLQDGQVVILNPGNFGGALEFYTVFQEKGTAKDVVFAEAECMIYACRKKDPVTIWIRGYKKGLRIAALPAHHNNRVMSLIQQVYPDVLPGHNIIETGLSNSNSIVHTPIMVLNAGLLERTKGDFLFYREGFTPKVGDVIDAMDRERLAIGDAFGVRMRSMYEQDLEWYGDQGASGDTLYETIALNPMYQWSKAPDSFNNRYLTEDIPYGLASVEDMGKKAGVSTPITSAIISLAGILVGKDLRAETRTLEKFGLHDKSISEIIDFFGLE
jgi:opine dehydrogenase